MRYEFKYIPEQKAYFAKFIDNGYEEFGGWFCCEPAVANIFAAVESYAKKLESGKIADVKVVGAEYVTHLTPEGISVQCIYAFDGDTDEFPETHKIPVEEMLFLIREWKQLTGSSLRQ